MGFGVLGDDKLAHVPGECAKPDGEGKGEDVVEDEATRCDGVLEWLTDVFAIGTSTLEDFDAAATLARGRDTSTLKKNKNGIILVPQPSDDPRDPLV